ncbi:MAG: ABC transporter ATP-binding protein/permease [Clostridia bacterium]|nr:ABC transporter ATP-binding protein/permease [Clostridia bacterium]
MLELKRITKEYISAEDTVHALKGIDVVFRENEFVSILGPSGCGKTTTLNIVGGLDRYTDGDLVINGVSTKQFKDKDWDNYRNHRIGFIFQSYNLIPHQTVLENVELALTIAGLSKAERRKKATEMLEKVGLSDKLNNKPNQLSGGQCQRVAIARALVNDPDILLADEPTGALDSKTSVQIMDLLKEIAKDKLVIMVTHNPELANEYSTRIIRLLDGCVIDDTMPVGEEEYKRLQKQQSERLEKKKEEAKGKKVKKEKASMSFCTALSLSFKNMLTKKGRTTLVSFAGSIGIIGIALILSLSSGFQTYIDTVEKDTLSSYPIQITKQTIDYASLMAGMKGEGSTEHDRDDAVYPNQGLSNLFQTMVKGMVENNLSDFKSFLDSGETDIMNHISAVQYGYDIDINVYGKDSKGETILVNESDMMEELFGAMAGGSSSGMPGMSMPGETVGLSALTSNIWTEMIDNQELLDSQYEVVAGRWARNYDELVVVVDENNEINDYVLYALGYYDRNEMREQFDALLAGKEFDYRPEPISFEEVMAKTYKAVFPTSLYEKQSDGTWKDMSEDVVYLEKIMNDPSLTEDLRITGIIRKRPDATAGAIGGTIGYTSGLTRYYISKVENSQIVKEQRANPETDIFTGHKFPTQIKITVEMADLMFKQYLTTLPEEQAAFYEQFWAGQSDEMKIKYVESMMVSDSTFEGNLKKLQVVDLNAPSSIQIYPTSFEDKDAIADAIKAYNDTQRDAGKEENIITYTDYIGLMMSSITTIVNAVTYVLIAFVSISLVVSSIMIGIITYISVLERIKEIGVLRAVGASKKDVSRVFTAEALIIGFAAGAMGVIITVLLDIPINIILHVLTNVAGLSAVLPWIGAVALIVISMLLTLIAGSVPARLAAKKDPVEALRSE